MYPYCYVSSILYICFHRASWHYFATRSEGFPRFSSVLNQIPGCYSQRRGTARPLPKLIVLFHVFCVCKCVLWHCHRVFVCKCVLCYCHRVFVCKCVLCYCQRVFVCKRVLCYCHRVFVCKCVLCYCHQVSTQLQLTNISIYQHTPLNSNQTPPVFLSTLSFKSCPKSAPIRRSVKWISTWKHISKRRKTCPEIFR
jgi:hypothetical protein